MIGTLVRGTVPGARVQLSTAPVDQSVGAARARLRLDLDPVHALGDLHPEALRSVTQALVEAPSGLIQFALSPDERWQTRARRTLDPLPRVPPQPRLLPSLLACRC